MRYFRTPTTLDSMDDSPRAMASSVLLVVAVLVSGVATFALSRRWQSCLEKRIAELEIALEVSAKERAGERRGRIRAQQALRKYLLDKDANSACKSSFPMVPIGFIQSCFTTRNGTPRQPLLVPLARACLILPPEGVPATAFDGLTGYSHCWLVYIFHANTDLPHIWNQPSHKDFKAKVRVPRLDGGKLGVFATRTPHRPCPIGLSVAKVEGVYGRMLLLSGVDLVDGTPVLDVKPYLPYCDIVGDATAPSWVKAGDEDDVIALASVEFSPRFEKELAKNWGAIVKLSMYSSPEEFQALIRQVLSRDIRSLRQRKHPRPSTSCASVSIDEDHGQLDFLSSEDATACSWLESEDKSALEHNVHNVIDAVHDGLVVYRLTLEGVVISYIVDSGHVTVEGIDVPNSTSGSVRECNYSTWMKVLPQECTDTIWA